MYPSCSRRGTPSLEELCQKTKSYALCVFVFNRRLHHLEHMPEFGFLGFEVVLGSLGWRDLDRNTFSHLDAGGMQGFEFSRIIRHQAHAGHSELAQHLSAEP